MLDCRASIEAENAQRVSPLHLAAIHGLYDTCRAFLQLGAPVGEHDSKGRPPIQRALRYCHPEIGMNLRTSYRVEHVAVVVVVVAQLTHTGLDDLQ